MDSIKRVTRYHLTENKKYLTKFWSILLIVNVISYIINSRYASGGFIGVHHNDGYSNYLSVAGANILAIFISFIVYSYENYYESFPILLSFSVTRKDFFKSTIISDISMAFGFSVIQGILMKIDPIVIKSIGKNPIYDFTIFSTQTDSIIYIILLLFIAFSLIIVTWNLIASINYKFGYKMWIVLVVLNILLFNVRISGTTISDMGIFRYIYNIGSILNQRVNFLQLTKLSLVIAIIYTIIYFVNINTDIKSSKN